METVANLKRDRTSVPRSAATEEEDRMNWRGVRMDDELREAVAKAKQTVLEKNDFNIEAVEKYLKAA